MRPALPLTTQGTRPYGYWCCSFPRCFASHPHFLSTRDAAPLLLRAAYCCTPARASLRSRSLGHAPNRHWNLQCTSPPPPLCHASFKGLSRSPIAGGRRSYRGDRLHSVTAATIGRRVCFCSPSPHFLLTPSPRLSLYPPVSPSFSLLCFSALPRPTSFVPCSLRRGKGRQEERSREAYSPPQTHTPLPFHRTHRRHTHLWVRPPLFSYSILQRRWEARACRRLP